MIKLEHELRISYNSAEGPTFLLRGEIIHNFGRNFIRNLIKPCFILFIKVKSPGVNTNNDGRGRRFSMSIYFMLIEFNCIFSHFIEYYHIMFIIIVF